MLEPSFIVNKGPNLDLGTNFFQKCKVIDCHAQKLLGKYFKEIFIFS